MLARPIAAGKVAVKVAGGACCAFGAFAFASFTQVEARVLAAGMGVSSLLMFKGAIEDATVVMYGKPKPKTKKDEGKRNV